MATRTCPKCRRPASAVRVFERPKDGKWVAVYVHAFEKVKAAGRTFKKETDACTVETKEKPRGAA